MTDLFPKLRLRIAFSPDFILGPGKADLLELIRDTGSISAAGRRMNMSYKRAWMLVASMNDSFREPLVDSARGGAKGGGASLTSAGEQVLARYRRIQQRLAEATAEDVQALGAMLVDMPEGK